MKKDEISEGSRRNFIKKTAFACAAFPFLTHGMASEANFNKFLKKNKTTMASSDKSIIGAYGQWAAGLSIDPPKLSFRNTEWTTPGPWKKEAFKKAKELVSEPDIKRISEVEVNKKYVYDGLEIEELSWQLSNGGPRTEAILLKPQGVKGKLPAVLGLHDHGGNKYFGKRKITRVSDDLHPLIEAHQKEYYENKAWANEIAKKGYVVLVHDTFTFGSRRVKYGDVEGILWGDCAISGKMDQNPETSENIATYNNWAGHHEHIMAKSLFSSGTTWPGVTLAEDRAALDVLCERADVDAENVGCAGLSGGGLRTVYLGGMNPRIKCAVCVGFMTTWRDFILNKSFSHTWMAYAPLLPKYLEFPEILGLRVPLPVLVQNNNQDSLYTLPEMKKADAILKEVYDKAGAADKYRTKFYGGEHKFDLEMQSDAFAWFDTWLK